MKIDKRPKRDERPKEVIALVCPDCGGTNISYQAGMITGQKYHCADCHYRGAFILERRVTVEEGDEVEEH